MAATIIDGKAIAQQMQNEMKAEVEELVKKGVTPRLDVILVGEDPASQVYVRNKGRACDRLGVASGTHRVPESASEEEILRLIEEFNKDPKVHGILVQLPLPDHVNEGAVLNFINPDKDVDGFHPVNVGRMVVNEPGFLPCTPHGIQMLLIRSGIETKGKHVVIVGRSNIVGKPVANILLQKKDGANAVVTVVHTAAPDMSVFTRQADILVVAVGRSEMITADMVKEGVVVIDVGINRVEDSSKEKGYRLTGDVDFAGVSEKASYITPVPGGVGPMTITMLLHNTIEAARRTI
ncbi:MAG: bifunctional methylenetetrahydrofolate dehydrogenase/methenyltetrahydrofolate cyclohydrolase FolD [Candidatus Latescibacteria bacterium]|nr:bifunctional methylenetetrahydrofolate dehydrogenase/methenyltetrahydrofolate cyclohydrolase FolD [Candidatus Latescibacterota bacterium]